MLVRMSRWFAVGFLAVAGLALAEPAGAADVTQTWNLTCTASLNGAPVSQAQSVTVRVSVPDQVDAGSTFNVTLPGGDATLPGSALGGAVTITQFTDLSTTYHVGGGTLTGDFTSSGPPLDDGVPIAAGIPVINAGAGTFKISTPGPVTPGTLTTPTLNFAVEAGAAGSTVTVNAVELKTTAHLHGIGTAAVTCNIPNDILTTTNVVEPPPPPPPPPPPGAPNTVNDGPVSTGQNEAITVDVLANDEPADENTPIDPTTLAIKEAPDDGTAEVVDGEIVYTPNDGFSGRDIFSYEVCSEDITDPETEEVIEGACHFAFVTVDVALPPTPETTVPTTVAPQATTTPTTVAGTATLPVTGSSTGALPMLAIALLFGGATTVALVRRRAIR